eukprot:gene7305-4481_t
MAWRDGARGCTRPGRPRRVVAGGTGCLGGEAEAVPGGVRVAPLAAEPNPPTAERVHGANRRVAYWTLDEFQKYFPAKARKEWRAAGLLLKAAGVGPEVEAPETAPRCHAVSKYISERDRRPHPRRDAGSRGDAAAPTGHPPSPRLAAPAAPATHGAAPQQQASQRRRPVERVHGANRRVAYWTLDEFKKYFPSKARKEWRAAGLLLKAAGVGPEVGAPETAPHCHAVSKYLTERDRRPHPRREAGSRGDAAAPTGGQPPSPRLAAPAAGPEGRRRPLLRPQGSGQCLVFWTRAQFSTHLGAGSGLAWRDAGVLLKQCSIDESVKHPERSPHNDAVRAYLVASGKLAGGRAPMGDDAADLLRKCETVLAGEAGVAAVLAEEVTRLQKEVARLDGAAKAADGAAKAADSARAQAHHELEQVRGKLHEAQAQPVLDALQNAAERPAPEAPSQALGASAPVYERQ